MLEKVILVGAHAPSYAVGSKLLEVVGEISISGRQLNNLTAKIGTELAGQRDASVAAYVDEPLPREHRTAETPIALAYVSIDGGRMQTRLDGGGLGVHDPHWRETKNALFLGSSAEFVGGFTSDMQQRSTGASPLVPSFKVNRST